jgi:crossover junction endodeoxyribonuclease RusA
MADLHLTLPLPPSLNHSHRNYTTANGRRMRVPTNATKQYTDAARVLATDAVNRTGWTCTQKQKVVVDLTVYWPDKRRRDCDNVIKRTLDACTGIIWDDDCWCLPRVQDFATDKADPRVEVVVRRV